MALEVALEDDNDLFFADLNRQISLLIDDDDNNDHYPTPHFPSISQGYIGSMMHHPTIMQTQYLYQENCRREIMSKGTGVFIPQSMSSQPRKKSKQAKRSPQSYTAKSKSNNNNKNNRRVANTVAHTNLPQPNYITNYVNRY